MVFTAKNEEPATEFIKIRVTPTMKDELKKLAARRGITLTDLLLEKFDGLGN